MGFNSATSHKAFVDITTWPGGIGWYSPSTGTCTATPGSLKSSLVSAVKQKRHGSNCLSSSFSPTHYLAILTAVSRSLLILKHKRNIIRLRIGVSNPSSSFTTNMIEFIAYEKEWKSTHRPWQTLAKRLVTWLQGTPDRSLPHTQPLFVSSTTYNIHFERGRKGQIKTSTVHRKKTCFGSLTFKDRKL